MSNIILRMSEILPWRMRGAAEWLAVAKKYRPLDKALGERFGEKLTPQAFGQWLAEHRGETVGDMTLTGKHSSHCKAWRYHVGYRAGYIPPAHAIRYASLPAAVAAPPPPRPVPAKVEPPKPVEPPRSTVRFTPNVVDGPSGSIIKNAEPVDMAFNPHAREAPCEPAPYVVTLPPGYSVVRVPRVQALPPGVTRGSDGTRTGGRTWSVFDVFK